MKTERRMQVSQRVQKLQFQKSRIDGTRGAGCLEMVLTDKIAEGANLPRIRTKMSPRRDPLHLEKQIRRF